MNPFGKSHVLHTPDKKKWTLGRLTVAVIHGFQEFCASAEGDPFALVDKYNGKLPEAELLALFRQAREVKDQLDCFSLACPVAQKHLRREEGIAELYRLLLLEAHPDATADDGLYVAMNDPRALDKAIEHAQGKPPKNADAPAPAA